MIIAHLSGGFGNQLYSYACGYALAKRKGDKFAIDTAIQDADWFFRNPEIMKLNIKYDKRITYPIKRDIISRAFWNKIIYKMNIGFTTKELLESKFPNQHEKLYNMLNQANGNIYIKGNWGNEIYFRDCKDEIIKMFSLKKGFSENAATIYNAIKKKNTVSIHIRRGDYVRIGCAIKPEYYIDAMNHIAERISNPEFFCFSEDIKWAQNEFKELPYKIVYPEYESEDKDVEDFFLISSANHVICSNSSYSWWASYLNNNADKIVIMPYKKDSIWGDDFLISGCVPLPFELVGK